MNGWMDGWVNGWTEAWMFGWMDEGRRERRKGRDGWGEGVREVKDKSTLTHSDLRIAKANLSYQYSGTVVSGLFLNVSGKTMFSENLQPRGKVSPTTEY